MCLVHLKEQMHVMNIRVGEMTAGYGCTNGVHKTPHTGVDYACPVGTELHAPIDGVVIKVFDYGHRGLGKAVFVKTDQSNMYVVGHLSNIKVHYGQQIYKGDLLALSGNAGNSTGPHVHFGAFDMYGHHINPQHILQENMSFDIFINADHVVASAMNTVVDLVIAVPHMNTSIPNVEH